ncbi:decaprenyl-diphosphate synthase subunit 2 [Ceratina calcarata]|uniref:Decaprenyl-diphosphate synthase subunit 2 n=1 Tax=Ceratina calcarata TaxID=156304 RepID=A0AAJ7ISF7_9HYME|nr:decaprenyl-diphosphate synthase subunit 2 [Ceratina calcarata]
MSMSKVMFNLLKKNGNIAKRAVLSSDYNVYCKQRTVHTCVANGFRVHEVNKVEARLTGNQKPDWNRAVSEAEKIVGYPTSFLSLRWLLSDEIANVALHLRKLVGSNHPLLKTAKSVIYNGRNNMQAWGLIVLLISKAAGHLNVDDMEEDKAAGVLHSQRALAEVTEMIRTSHLVHKGLVNIESGDYLETSELNDMNFGNKIALLSGDYLLANSCAELANLRNQDIVELMSSAVRDLAEAEFIGRRDNQNNPLPSVPPEDRTDYAVNEWTLRNVLSAGALLGKSCKGTLKLAGHGDEIQEHGYNFGKHLALAWQACLDLSPFITKDRNVTCNLCSAPIMFHIEHDPSILIEIDKGLESINDVDYAKVYQIVTMGPGIELTKQLQKRHSQRAMEVLSVFEKSDARTALYNIIAAMGDF